MLVEIHVMLYHVSPFVRGTLNCHVDIIIMIITTLMNNALHTVLYVSGSIPGYILLHAVLEGFSCVGTAQNVGASTQINTGAT